MGDRVLPPRLGTRPDTLSSQLHEYETNDGTHDFHSPIVETTIPGAGSHVPDLTIALMLFKVYRVMLPIIFLFSVVFVIVFSTLTRPNYYHIDGNMLIDETRKGALNRLSYTIISPLLWHLFFYLVWTTLFLLSFLMWNDDKRIDRFQVCCVVLSTSLLLNLLLWTMSISIGERDVYRVTYSGQWRTGVLPTSPSVCGERLEEKQRILLDTEYYSAQFGRAIIYNATDRDSSDWPWVHLSFNETRFLQIHNNANICFQGFEGNQDLYGLGVRLGIYLQWITAFIANNFLPAARQSFRVSWLVLSIAMCILTFVASIADYCIFGIEIEVLYWLYWGGFTCVCASAPSQTRLAGQKRWVSLDWDVAIHYTMHTFMACHGLWFSWWGYDQVFARLPCGTYQFIFAKFLDPSVPYCYARDVLSAVLHSITIPLLLAIPFAIMIMAAELKGSIKDSAVYRMVFCCANVHTLEQGNQNIQETDESISNGDGSEHRLAWLCDRCLGVSRSVYYMVRRMAGMPEHRLGGIRLITPVDVRHRRFVHLSTISYRMKLKI